MLPDFPKLKKDLSQQLLEFLKIRVEVHLGSLSEIPRVSLFEGTGRRLKRYSGHTEHPAMQAIREELFVSNEELPHMTLDKVLSKLDNMAERIARQLAEKTYQTVLEAVERVGNVVDARDQKMSAELILEALSKVQIEFDRDGKARFPSIHIHPKLSKAAKLALAELETNPVFKQQFNKLIAQKYEEWRAREASRKLVG